MTKSGMLVRWLELLAELSTEEPLPRGQLWRLTGKALSDKELQENVQLVIDSAMRSIKPLVPKVAP